MVELSGEAEVEGEVWDQGSEFVLCVQERLREKEKEKEKEKE